jgi:mRNA interferase MazF
LTNPVGVHGHVILAFITSVIPSDLMATDIVLKTSDSDFAATGVTRIVCHSVASSDDSFHLADQA